MMLNKGVRRRGTSSRKYEEKTTSIWWSQQARDEPSIVKLEMTDNLVVSLTSDQTMSIWNRQTGSLMRDFQFLSPHRTLLLAAANRRRHHAASRNDSNSSSSTGARTHPSRTRLLIANLLRRPSRWLLYYRSSENFGYSSSSKKTIYIDSPSSRSPTRPVTTEQLPPPPAPTMCLYSRSVLITGGCSCIFLWNIWKGELMKKINIRKPPNNLNSTDEDDDDDDDAGRLALVNLIKDIRVIRQQQQPQSHSSGVAVNKVNKLVLVTDYTDAVYVLKIPSNLTAQTSYD